MVSSKTRFGNLGRAFKEGESELFNQIARICILYEDLRLELDELRLVQLRRDESRIADDDNYRAAYFIRRALVTLVEFRRVLTTLEQTPEFKAAFPSVDKDVLSANQFFQVNGRRLKELRNEFGGHVQPSAVKFATQHLSDAFGKITIKPSCNGWTLGLECHFAADLVAGAITSKLMGGADAKAELRTAMEMIGEGFLHVRPQRAFWSVRFCGIDSESNND